MDPDTGEPMDTLTKHAQQQIQTLGSRSTNVSEIVAQKERAVFDVIQEGLDRVNTHADSSAQKVSILCIADLSTLLSRNVLTLASTSALAVFVCTVSYDANLVWKGHLSKTIKPGF